MTASADLLVEIGTEELPPKALRRLSSAFTIGLEEILAGAGFAFTGVSGYATPRRLAVLVRDLASVQPARTETRRGPALAAAFDAGGQPTRAAEGFARSCGVAVADLGRLETAEGAWLSFEKHVAGRRLAEVLPAYVEQALGGLPIPKRMRWGARSAEFVRPVHWVVLLHGTEAIAGEVLGIGAGRSTRGHRFHHPEPITLAAADDYVTALDGGRVIAAFESRRERVHALVLEAATAAGGEAIVDADLLDEVTALVEWPVPVVGSFDAHFLALPPEVLVATMQDHQKYFPVRGADGRLLNRFITLSNLESRDAQAVRNGNERVIRPRLSDADFFWRSDRGRRLDSLAPRLADMLFEKRLGSLADKSARVERLARHLAAPCGADAEHAVRAAALARCDLLSSMVGEFPELQGTMGRYLAAADGEADAVAVAIGEFYQPRFAGDAIPASAVGRCVAVADKLDTLVGIFGIGAPPTGDRDPYALRRAAIGVLRILVEGGIDLDLEPALAAAVAMQDARDLAADTAREVWNFIRERLRGYYLDRGFENDVCEAVFAHGLTRPLEIDRRLHAVRRFRALPAAATLAAANKRTANLLRKAEITASGAVDTARLVERAEQDLAAALEAVAARAEPQFAAGDYAAYLETLAVLREPVDAFFDGVMVMAEDAALRANRLALLARLQALFTRVADIGRLHEV